MKKDLNFRRFVIVFCFFSVLSLFVFGGLLFKVYQQSVQSSNKVVATFVAEIQKKDPDISDEEIFDILNHPQTTSFFDHYGIDLEQTSVILTLQKEKQKMIFCFLISWGLIFGSIFYFLFRYNKKNQKEIQSVVQLIDDINHKIYTISLEEHCEDLYSLLKSELYKTTIMLKEQAENSELEKKALRTALSDISHQIKTPITSILIMLDTITDYPNMSPSQEKEFLEDIRNQIQRIHFLTMSLLKFAKLDSGVISFKEENILGRELIDSALENLEVLATAKNISFKISGNLTFVGDFQFLEEAFMNILKNAIEVSRENGKIFIDLEDNPLYSKITIKDEGIGIEEQEILHIFDRFFKSKNATSNSFGIGLSLSKKIIEANHGTICCKSQVGKGTTFEIKFLKRR